MPTRALTPPMADFSHGLEGGEKVPEGRMRGFAALQHARHADCGSGGPIAAHSCLQRRRQAPHPALRATFSPPSRGEGNVVHMPAEAAR